MLMIRYPTGLLPSVSLLLMPMPALMLLLFTGVDAGAVAAVGADGGPLQKPKPAGAPVQVGRARKKTSAEQSTS